MDEDVLPSYATLVIGVAEQAEYLQVRLTAIPAISRTIVRPGAVQHRGVTMQLTAVEAILGQLNGFFSQLPYKCDLWEIGSIFAPGSPPGWFT